jgi:hypothetical protein
MIDERSRRRSDLDENVATSLDGNIGTSYFTFRLKKELQDSFEAIKKASLTES